MKSKALEVVRGSGNYIRDFKKSSPDADQLKAILAAEIIKKLDRDGLTVRDAQTRTESRPRIPTVRRRRPR